MKRSTSFSGSESDCQSPAADGTETKALPSPGSSPHTPQKTPKAATAASGKNSPAKRSPKKVKAEDDEPGTWTAEKRATFIETIIAAGYRSVNLDELAKELGLNKRQLVNQLTLGRHNLRQKAVDAAKAG